MPTNINVADGKLANWHRFDAKDKAVVKDQSVLMSVADSTDNARDQIKTIWEKLGGTNTPPRVTSFNREDLAANKSSAVPSAPPQPVENSKTSTTITIDLSFANSLGGSAPIKVGVNAEYLGINILTETTFSPAWPWPTTATVTGLTAARTYNVKYRYSNSFGDGVFSSTKAITTPSILPLIMLISMIGLVL